MNPWESFTNRELDTIIELARGRKHEDESATLWLLNHAAVELHRRHSLNEERTITVKRIDTIAHCGAETTATKTWDAQPSGYQAVAVPGPHGGEYWRGTRGPTGDTPTGDTP